MSSNNTTTETSTAENTFNHSFEGWSVWIEPCEKDSVNLIKEIQHLAKQCGGAKCGVHSFAPHCTLLYNLTPLTNTKESSHEEFGTKLLLKCLDKFRQTTSDDDCDDPSDLHQQVEQHKQQHLQLTPTSFYYFPYPKHADDGKGFGCVISLIVLEKSPQLQRLHQAVSCTFPPDERHDNFVPHVSLVYAPESRAEWLQQYTQDLSSSKQELLEPLQAKYLSLWSARGQVKDWYRIARVEL